MANGDAPDIKGSMADVLAAQTAINQNAGQQGQPNPGVPLQPPSNKPQLPLIARTIAEMISPTKQGPSSNNPANLAMGPQRPSRVDSFHDFLGQFITSFASGLMNAGTGPGAPGRGFGAAVMAPQQMNQENYQQQLQAQQQQQMAAQQQQLNDSLIKSRLYDPQIQADRDRAAAERQAAAEEASAERQRRALEASDKKMLAGFEQQSSLASQREASADARLNRTLEAQESRLGRSLAASAAQENGIEKNLQAEARVSSVEFDLDRMADAARLLKNHPGLSAAVGVPGITKFLPGTDAAGFMTNLETLRSQIAFSTLQKMREMSKTGGALGQVSDKEGQLLQNNVTGLDTKQQEKEFIASLDRLIKFAGDSRERLRGSLGTPTSPNGRPTGGQAKYRYDPAAGRIVPK